MSSLDQIHHNGLDHQLVMPEEGTTIQMQTTPKPEQASRHTNLQRIQQRKQAVLGFPYNRKLLKLAIYSKCQVFYLCWVVEVL